MNQWFIAGIIFLIIVFAFQTYDQKKYVKVPHYTKKHPWCCSSYNRDDLAPECKENIIDEHTRNLCKSHGQYSHMNDHRCHFSHYKPEANNVTVNPCDF